LTAELRADIPFWASGLNFGTFITSLQCMGCFDSCRRIVSYPETVCAMPRNDLHSINKTYGRVCGSLILSGGGHMVAGRTEV